MDLLLRVRAYLVKNVFFDSRGSIESVFYLFICLFIIFFSSRYRSIRTPFDIIYGPKEKEEDAILKESLEFVVYRQVLGRYPFPGVPFDLSSSSSSCVFRDRVDGSIKKLYEETTRRDNASSLLPMRPRACIFFFCLFSFFHSRTRRT